MGWALITGASSGMGLEYARQLAAGGHDILLVSNQQEQLIQVTADIVDEFGVNAVPRYEDLSSEAAAQNLLEWTLEAGYEVDTLICNAGMFFFKELRPENMSLVETMIQLHVATNTRLCILFGNEMKRRGTGSILIVSSMVASLPAPGIAIYSASKAYLKNFGKSLHYEMKPYGVKVTTVCPGAVATPLYRLKPSIMKLGVKAGVIWTPQRLVRRALNALHQGRTCIKPGFMNIWLPLAFDMLPPSAESRAWNICIRKGLGK